MVQRPSNVTDCAVCGKEVGVQKEFNMNPHGSPAWRMSVHGGKTRCLGSRVEIPNAQVRRKRYSLAV